MNPLAMGPPWGICWKVNDAFRQAAAGSLQGILGYEERPLVSVDYRHDYRSCIIDGPSTLGSGLITRR